MMHRKEICFKKSDLLNTLKLNDILNKINEIWNQDYLFFLRKSCRDIYETDFSNKIKEIK